MDVTEIVTAFGAYYVDAGQNKKRILGLLTQGLALPQYCTPIKTDDTVFTLGQLTMGSLVQPFQKSWTPKNASALLPKEIRQYKLKIDEDVVPDDIDASWAGFLAGEGVTKSEWPLVKFMIEHPEQGIIAKINEDMELKVYGHGVYKAPTPGTAGDPEDSMNGLIKLLQDGVNDETINSINIGTLDKDTIFDQVEEFVDGISQVYQNVKMNLFMSPYWAKMYHRDKRGQGFYQIASDANVENTIDFSPQQVVGVPALSGSNAIFATPKTNLIHLTKRSANKTTFRVEEAKRTVSIMTDWWEGLGFGINIAVWTNLQKETGSAGESV